MKKKAKDMAGRLMVLQEVEKAKVFSVPTRFKYRGSRPLGEMRSSTKSSALSERGSLRTAGRSMAWRRAFQ
jgi:hypothetical protein